MKKIVLSFLLVVIMSSFANAQLNSNDFGRVIINPYLPASLSVDNEAKNLLETKLKEIVSTNGLGGSSIDHRFIITANVNVITKNIIPGAPAKVSQKINVTLFIGDAVSNTVFSSMTLNVIGVGNNENQSFIDAFNNINPGNKLIKEFLEKGNNKIISYYSTQCDFIIKDAETLAKRHQYDEAIYKLALVPQVCRDCYMISQKSIQKIYKQKIDYEGAASLAKAKTIWMTNPDMSGAEQVRALIDSIDPQASCYHEVAPLVKKIRAKILADEKRQWQFEMKQHDDRVELEKRRTDAWREIAVEFAKNLPQSIKISIW